MRYFRVYMNDDITTLQVSNCSVVITQHPAHSCIPRDHTHAGVGPFNVPVRQVPTVTAQNFELLRESPTAFEDGPEACGFFGLYNARGSNREVTLGEWNSVEGSRSSPTARMHAQIWTLFSCSRTYLPGTVDPFSGLRHRLWVCESRN